MIHRRDRVPYFLRPAPRRDWRWWVGIVGRTLIVIGLLMFAFVAYQLWGTGIQTAQAQNDLKGQFQELLDSTSTTTSTTVADTVDTVPSTDETTTTSSTIPVADPSNAAEGSPVARLHIEKIGLDYTVVEGVGVADLKKGPGHFPETPMPGQLGNAAIAGHRTTYGGPFFDLDQLQPGDLVEISTLAGHYVYAVTDSLVVNPADYAAVIPTVDPNVATLTLTTCTPKYTAKQRLVVHATLVADRSDAVLRPPSATVPGDTTVPSTIDTLPGESVPDTTTADTTPASTTTTPDALISDSFEQGWFDDTAAIPQAVLWGLALVAVSIGAYLVGKKAKRLWVCWLVGVVPFVVLLYFFFENVNRLLPPSI